ncbi:MAG: hypothetical protein AB7G28_07115 [Pirellulales bacterium]
MDQIIVDAGTGQALSVVVNQVVVCDSNGIALGFFSPLKDHPPVSQLQLEPPLSIAETEELRQKHRTGKPLEEILRRHGL